MAAPSISGRFRPKGRPNIPLPPERQTKTECAALLFVVRIFFKEAELRHFDSDAFNQSFIPRDFEATFVRRGEHDFRGRIQVCSIGFQVKEFAERFQAGYRTLNRSEEHTSELQSQSNLVCRLLLEKK